eukprot:TRINITY_DN676_c0_g1_i1.p1 TRINITY_DN676_c0_g1~~TRINITY_DN676_c0_g1_i1.p1  ORF type:complete len:3030 (+),score=1278.03 TRINITY_DN676_c0_g1_i1:148-9090(+)
MVEVVLDDGTVKMIPRWKLNKRSKKKKGSKKKRKESLEKESDSDCDSEISKEGGKSFDLSVGDLCCLDNTGSFGLIGVLTDIDDCKSVATLCLSNGAIVVAPFVDVTEFVPENPKTLFVKRVVLKKIAPELGKDCDYGVAKVLYDHGNGALTVSLADSSLGMIPKAACKDSLNIGDCLKMWNEDEKELSPAKVTKVEESGFDFTFEDGKVQVCDSITELGDIVDQVPKAPLLLKDKPCAFNAGDICTVRDEDGEFMPVIVLALSPNREEVNVKLPDGTVLPSIPSSELGSCFESGSAVYTPDIDCEECLVNSNNIPVTEALIGAIVKEHEDSLILQLPDGSLLCAPTENCSVVSDAFTWNAEAIQKEENKEKEETGSYKPGDLLHLTNGDDIGLVGVVKDIDDKGVCNVVLSNRAIVAYPIDEVKPFNAFGCKNLFIKSAALIKMAPEIADKCDYCIGKLLLNHRDGALSVCLADSSLVMVPEGACREHLRVGDSFKQWRDGELVSVTVHEINDDGSMAVKCEDGTVIACDPLNDDIIPEDVKTNLEDFSPIYNINDLCAMPNGPCGEFTPAIVVAYADDDGNCVDVKLSDGTLIESIPVGDLGCCFQYGTVQYNPHPDRIVKNSDLIVVNEPTVCVDLKDIEQDKIVQLPDGSLATIPAEDCNILSRAYNWEPEHVESDYDGHSDSEHSSEHEEDNEEDDLFGDSPKKTPVKDSMDTSLELVLVYDNTDDLKVGEFVVYSAKKGKSALCDVAGINEDGTLELVDFDDNFYEHVPLEMVKRQEKDEESVENDTLPLVKPIVCTLLKKTDGNGNAVLEKSNGHVVVVKESNVCPLFNVGDVVKAIDQEQNQNQDLDNNEDLYDIPFKPAEVTGISDDRMTVSLEYADGSIADNVDQTDLRPNVIARRSMYLKKKSINIDGENDDIDAFIASDSSSSNYDSDSEVDSDISDFEDIPIVDNDDDEMTQDNNKKKKLVLVFKPDNLSEDIKVGCTVLYSPNENEAPKLCDVCAINDDDSLSLVDLDDELYEHVNKDSVTVPETVNNSSDLPLVTPIIGEVLEPISEGKSLIRTSSGSNLEVPENVVFPLFVEGDRVTACKDGVLDNDVMKYATFKPAEVTGVSEDGMKVDLEYADGTIGENVDQTNLRPNIIARKSMYVKSPLKKPRSLINANASDDENASDDSSSDYSCISGTSDDDDNSTHEDIFEADRKNMVLAFKASKTNGSEADINLGDSVLYTADDVPHPVICDVCALNDDGTLVLVDLDNNMYEDIERKFVTCEPTSKSSLSNDLPLVIPLIAEKIVENENDDKITVKTQSGKELTLPKSNICPIFKVGDRVNACKEKLSGDEDIINAEFKPAVVTTLADDSLTVGLEFADGETVDNVNQTNLRPNMIARKSMYLKKKKSSFDDESDSSSDTEIEYSTQEDILELGDIQNMNNPMLYFKPEDIGSIDDIKNGDTVLYTGNNSLNDHPVLCDVCAVNPDGTFELVDLNDELYENVSREFVEPQPTIKTSFGELPLVKPIIVEKLETTDDDDESALDGKITIKTVNGDELSVPDYTVCPLFKIGDRVSACDTDFEDIKLATFRPAEVTDVSEEDLTVSLAFADGTTASDINQSNLRPNAIARKSMLINSPNKRSIKNIDISDSLSVGSSSSSSDESVIDDLADSENDSEYDVYDSEESDIEEVEHIEHSQKVDSNLYLVFDDSKSPSSDAFKVGQTVLYTPEGKSPILCECGEVNPDGTIELIDLNDELYTHVNPELLTVPEPSSASSELPMVTPLIAKLMEKNDNDEMVTLESVEDGETLVVPEDKICALFGVGDMVNARKTDDSFKPAEVIGLSDNGLKVDVEFVDGEIVKDLNQTDLRPRSIKLGLGSKKSFGINHDSNSSSSSSSDNSSSDMSGCESGDELECKWIVLSFFGPEELPDKLSVGQSVIYNTNESIPSICEVVKMNDDCTVDLVDINNNKLTNVQLSRVIIQPELSKSVDLPFVKPELTEVLSKNDEGALLVKTNNGGSAIVRRIHYCELFKVGDLVNAYTGDIDNNTLQPGLYSPAEVISVNKDNNGMTVDISFADGNIVKDMSQEFLRPLFVARGRSICVKNTIPKRVRRDSMVFSDSDGSESACTLSEVSEDSDLESIENDQVVVKRKVNLHIEIDGDFEDINSSDSSDNSDNDDEKSQPQIGGGLLMRASSMVGIDEDDEDDDGIENVDSDSSPSNSDSDSDIVIVKSDDIKDENKSSDDGVIVSPTSAASLHSRTMSVEDLEPLSPGDDNSNDNNDIDVISTDGSDSDFEEFDTLTKTLGNVAAYKLYDDKSQTPIRSKIDDDDVVDDGRHLSEVISEQSDEEATSDDETSEDDLGVPPVPIAKLPLPDGLRDTIHDAIHAHMNDGDFSDDSDSEFVMVSPLRTIGGDLSFTESTVGDDDKKIEEVEVEDNEDKKSISDSSSSSDSDSDSDKQSVSDIVSDNFSDDDVDEQKNNSDNGKEEEEEKESEKKNRKTRFLVAQRIPTETINDAKSDNEDGSSHTMGSIDEVDSDEESDGFSEDDNFASFSRKPIQELNRTNSAAPSLSRSTPVIPPKQYEPEKCNNLDGFVENHDPITCPYVGICDRGVVLSDPMARGCQVTSIDLKTSKIEVEFFDGESQTAQIWEFRGFPKMDGKVVSLETGLIDVAMKIDENDGNLRLRLMDTVTSLKNVVPVADVGSKMFRCVWNGRNWLTEVISVTYCYNDGGFEANSRSGKPLGETKISWVTNINVIEANDESTEDNWNARGFPPLDGRSASAMELNSNTRNASFKSVKMEPASLNPLGEMGTSDDFGVKEYEAEQISDFEDDDEDVSLLDLVSGAASRQSVAYMTRQPLMSRRQTASSLASLVRQSSVNSHLLGEDINFNEVNSPRRSLSKTMSFIEDSNKRNSIDHGVEIGHARNNYLLTHMSSNLSIESNDLDISFAKAIAGSLDGSVDESMKSQKSNEKSHEDSPDFEDPLSGFF